MNLSRFMTPKTRRLTPYTPGEQPSERKYIKLNTNESPFPPSEKAIMYSSDAVRLSNLYPPLDGGPLRGKLADYLGVPKECVAIANSSDEILNFIFRAFCGEDSPAAFADITYGFYPVFSSLNGAPYTEIPLKEDFTLDIGRFIGIHKNIFIANPNAPTGIEISGEDIERIAESNPDNIVVIDEAYVDFGGRTAIPLVDRHDNLIVVQTFSKSRSLAGARVGFAVSNPEIIKDIYTVIYSTNPYNISRANMFAAIGAIEDDRYTKDNCRKIISTRERISGELKELGFRLTDSRANFIFCEPPDIISGKELYQALRERGILVRRFDVNRIENYLRISVGTDADMDQLINAIKNTLNI